ncbi:MAG: hypothetical protein PHN69_06390 [Candidatus Pacebacteria bacterium]|nr:hypothetical protein [Candidatus Paceibacterota bacterium]
MSTLKVRLEVAVNLALGVYVFSKHKEETERIAKILDVHAAEIAEERKDTRFGRAFKFLEGKKRKLISLRIHVSNLKRRIHTLYKAGPETIVQLGVTEIAELEKWFDSLVTEHSYEKEFDIDCPWFMEPAPVEEELVQATA